MIYNGKRGFSALITLLLLAAIIPLVLFSCTTMSGSAPAVSAGRLAEYTPVYPETEFCVISDLHLYDKSLGTEGEKFSEYLDNDRKMLAESEEILLESIKEIKAEKPAFVIIPGDLTKDGELTSHQLTSAHLTELEAAGIKVYVVPGNHDILNPKAVRFLGDKTERVPNINADDFRKLYAQFGYKEALYSDPASLSYAAEPVPGLWLLALDSCDYSKNRKLEEAETDGKFTRETLQWIEYILQTAAEKKKAVVAFMHHGITEHFDSQEKFFGMYIVDRYKKVDKLFAKYKVRTVFTGHFHAQDITLAYHDGQNFVYDIETGSLVTYPSPIRTVRILPDQTMHIDSSFIEKLPSFSKNHMDFRKYAKDSVYSGIEVIAVKTMMELHMSRAEAETLSGQIADAFVAHYQGDEHFSGKEMLKTGGLSFIGRIVVGNRKPLVYGLWHDKEPPDNKIIINLSNGSWKENRVLKETAAR